MYFPSFSELLLIGSGLGMLLMIVFYVQTGKEDKVIKSKIKKYFFLLLILYLIMLFVTN